MSAAAGVRPTPPAIRAGDATIWHRGVVMDPVDQTVTLEEFLSPEGRELELVASKLVGPPRGLKEWFTANYEALSPPAVQCTLSWVGLV